MGFHDVRRRTAVQSEVGKHRSRALRASGRRLAGTRSLVDGVVALGVGSPGRRIDASDCELMERRLGHHFSDVRVHSGGDAARSATAINARAFTVGGHVVLGKGEYRPRTPSYRRLLAHELVHTVQQGRDVGTTSLELGAPGSAAETEAENVAASAVGTAAERAAAPVPIQRRPPAVSRVELKNGDAKFKLDPYDIVDSDKEKDTARQVGVNFDLTYTSAPSYRSDKIGFIQTMKTLKDGTPYLFANEKARATTAKEGEAGWAIDRLAGKKSPFYGQENSGAAGGNAKFGYRKSKSDAKDAFMHDKLALNRAVGQTVSVTAVTFALDASVGSHGASPPTLRVRRSSRRRPSSRRETRAGFRKKR